MKITFNLLFQLLLFSSCYNTESHDKVTYPKIDKSSSIYAHIKADTLFKILSSTDFKIIEIRSTNIKEGSCVNARIQFKRKNILQNETQDSTFWINEIIMSPNNEIIKWGSVGDRSKQFRSIEGEKTYHTPLIINKQ